MSFQCTIIMPEKMMSNFFFFRPMYGELLPIFYNYSHIFNILKVTDYDSETEITVHINCDCGEIWANTYTCLSVLKQRVCHTTNSDLYPFL